MVPGRRLTVARHRNCSCQVSKVAGCFPTNPTRHRTSVRRAVVAARIASATSGPRPGPGGAGIRRSDFATGRYPRGDRAQIRLTYPAAPLAETAGLTRPVWKATGFPTFSCVSVPKPSVLLRHTANDVGVEPTTPGLQVPCSTIELVVLEQSKGIEPSASRPMPGALPLSYNRDPQNAEHAAAARGAPAGSPRARTRGVQTGAGRCLSIRATL